MRQTLKIFFLNVTLEQRQKSNLVYLPRSKWLEHQSMKNSEWIAATIMPSSYCTSLWEQCYAPWVQYLLVRSYFSNIICLKRSAEYPNIMNDQVFPSDIPSLMARAYSKMTVSGLMWLKLWKSRSGGMRYNFHTWIGHHRAQTLKVTYHGKSFFHACTKFYLYSTPNVISKLNQLLTNTL